MIEEQQIKFEEGYIFRNCRSITSSPDIALTELVANAWDAGAKNVFITIPENEDSKLSIVDDGSGMSEEEFSERWMTLNYNRTKHQGGFVKFPEEDGEVKKKRLAYGRNGIGRHGMLCFSDSYVIQTWKNGKGIEKGISVSSGAVPFKIISKKEIEKDGHGTSITVYLNRNKPDIKQIRDILSGRFIYDPQFKVSINGEHLDLLSSEGFIKEENVETENGKKLKISIIDSTKSAKKSQQHGIAFWIGGRLVGIPSWVYGRYQFMDARYRIAKRYTIIVQTDDLMEEVLPDWTGFLDSYTMDCVYKKVKKVVDDLIKTVMTEQVEDIKHEVIEETRDDLKNLRLSEKREISSFIEELTTLNPMMDSSVLKTSVEALLKIQKAKKGEELLRQISNMSEEDIAKLSDLLKYWDINDVLSVIDEIDKRILVVEAISKVYEEKSTDELHTLHPMVLNAKWLFGAEFDSPMFVSNRTLNTVMKTLFKEEEFDLDVIVNPRRRPDIVCLNRATIRAVSTDRVDIDAGSIMKPDQILIIELKRGGFEIDSAEVSQAEYYVRQIKKSGQLHNASSIRAFVVGCSIGDVDHHKVTDSGIIDVVTYGQLVDTATSKLFGLRKTLEEHYQAFDDESIVEKALKEPSQIKIVLDDGSLYINQHSES
jgi:hypothetical protein